MITKETELIIDKICRCCMCENENMHNVFENKKDAGGSSPMLLSEMLVACASVEVVFGDGLPYNLCDSCESKLNTAYEFRQQCQKTDSALRELANAESKDNITKQEDIIIQPDVPEDLFDEEDNLPLIKRGVKRKCGRPKKKDGDNFACTFCHKVLHTKKGLRVHLRTHAGEKMRRCLFCDAKYTRTNHLIRHIGTHDKPGLTHKCRHCDKTFTAAADLFKHSREHEEAENRDDIIKQEEEEIKSDIDPVDESVKPNESNLDDMENIDDNNDDFADFPFSDDSDDNPTDSDEDFIVNIKKQKKDQNKKNKSDGTEKDKVLYPCRECTKVMKTSNGLKIHMRKHTRANLSFCKVWVTDQNNESLEQTAEIINGTGLDHNVIDDDDDDGIPPIVDVVVKKVRSNSQICHVCGVSFARTNQLAKHMTLHQAVLVHQCDRCEKAFASEDFLKKHVEEYHINKPYVCRVCNKSFSKGQYLIKHLKVHQPNPDKEGNLKCSICDSTFTSSDLLASHIKDHILQDKRHVCNECGRAFNRLDNLKAHQKTHTGVKDTSKLHLCVYCGKEFSNSSNMIVHMRRHTGERPYKCSECGKAFPRSNDLKCHERIHSGEKPYLCTLCGKSFNKSHKLVRHSRVHTGERPYVCNICGKGFTQSNILSLHMRRHTGIRPYACGVCPARYNQSGQLKTHRKTTGHLMDTKPELKGGYRVEPVTPTREPRPIMFKSHGELKKEVVKEPPTLEPQSMQETVETQSIEEIIVEPKVELI